jgi:hypothetical protein
MLQVKVYDASQKTSRTITADVAGESRFSRSSKNDGLQSRSRSVLIDLLGNATTYRNAIAQMAQMRS